MTVHFALNVPLQLALSDPTGDYDPQAEQVSYPTTDGRILILPVRAAEKLNALELKPQEPFGMCKRWEGTRGTLPYFDFWLSPATEKARAAEEIAAAATPTPEPAPKPKRARRPKVEPIQTPTAPPLQPSFWDGRATGTYGPTPRPAIAAALRPPRIPYNIAFREVVRFVTAALAETGEQWTDAAKQDAVSTILISASQQGLLSLWERPEQ